MASDPQSIKLKRFAVSIVQNFARLRARVSPVDRLLMELIIQISF
jgi:hypothetical protein